MTNNSPLPGRSRELGTLRLGFDDRNPSIRWVVGLPGVGKTKTVLRAAASLPLLHHRVPPLSGPLQRAALASTLNSSMWNPDGLFSDWESGDPPDWERLFNGIVRAAPEGRTTVCVVDDAHRWVESRARFEPALHAALHKAQAKGKCIHVLLLAPELPATRLGDEHLLPPLFLKPLSFRAAEPFLPGVTPWDRLRAFAVFGGLPGVLSLLKPKATLRSNLNRLVLEPSAPLRDGPLTLLERFFQRPNRYASLLAALAPGEGDWGTVQAGVGDLTASGQAGPYLKRLEDVGLVEARRSLDASPRTRSRRYRIVDPFFAFWFRFVLPHRGNIPGPGGESLWTELLHRELDSHLTSVLPEVCRSFMVFDAMEQLGANARECGSLWGQDYDFPIAGVLNNGVPFYGQMTPMGQETLPSALSALDAQVRETRYGFGRERRLRMLFVAGTVSPDLHRKVASRDDVVLVNLNNLTGVA